MRIPGAFLAIAIATSATADQVRAPEVAIRPVSRGDAMVPVTANLSFDRWIAGFRDRAMAEGIRPDVLDTAFTGIRYNADVIDRDRNQSEFTRQIWDYLDSAVSEDRVRNGRAALQANAALLARIEDRYGVEAEVVTAIWGLESAYGSFRGSRPSSRRWRRSPMTAAAAPSSRRN
jgi:membrane-bound lytic murein transglycosylase B